MIGVVSLSIRMSGFVKIVFRLHPLNFLVLLDCSHLSLARCDHYPTREVLARLDFFYLPIARRAHKEVAHR